MSQTDWAKTYAEMDKRVTLKYQQLPNGEQVGKHPESSNRESAPLRGQLGFRTAMRE